MSARPATIVPPAQAPPASALSAPLTDERYRELAARVTLLSWLSLAWMTVEGAVAIVAGMIAGSIALIGFGLDSAIEGFASLVIIWRFSEARMFSPAAETRAQKLVAVQPTSLARRRLLCRLTAARRGRARRQRLPRRLLRGWSVLTPPQPASPAR